jgi:hypothetical protein
MTPRPLGRISPGEGLLHPVAGAAVALLILNDHVGKVHWPGLVTGKLSDVAGMVFFPLLLQALLEMGWVAVGRSAPPSARLLACCVVLTGCAFVAVKILPPFNELLEWAWGWLQAPAAMTSGAGIRPTVFTMDPTDLLALPVLALAWAVGKQRTEPPMRVEDSAAQPVTGLP